MAREIDESWIDEAIDRYRRLDQLRADFDKAVSAHSVSVHSPDDSIEVVVTAAGEVTDVRINGPLHHRNPAEFAREIQAVVTAAADAARWARDKLHGEVFGQWHSLEGTEMEHLADRLDRAADTLATVDRRLPVLAVAVAAFAADDAGLPGRLGRELHEHWAAVLDARSREAARLASRLADAAGSVRATKRQYTETDEAARRRLSREM